MAARKRSRPRATAKAQRKRWAPMVDAGWVACHRCGNLIRPGSAWDLDHIIPLSVQPSRELDPSNLRPAHRHCNRSHGATLGNRARASSPAVLLGPGGPPRKRQRLPPRVSGSDIENQSQQGADVAVWRSTIFGDNGKGSQHE